MLSAKELAAIEAQITWGHPNEQSLTNDQCRRLVAEIRRLERDNLALRDGLRGWQSVGTDAEKELTKVREKLTRAEIAIADASVAVDRFDYFEGTLAERIKQALEAARSSEGRDYGR